MAKSNKKQTTPPQDVVMYMGLPNGNIAQAIGELVVRSNQHEHCIKNLYATIIGVTPEQAHTILGKRRIADIRDECEQLFVIKTKNNAAIQKLGRLMNSSRELMSQRNDFIHSISGVSLDGDYLKKNKKNSRYIEQDAGTFRRIAEQLHKLNTELIAARHSDAGKNAFVLLALGKTK